MRCRRNITSLSHQTLTYVYAALLFAAAPAYALEWQTTPTVSLMSTNDDNYRLRTSDEREVSSSRLDASARITGSSDRLNVEFRPRARAIYFSDNREVDRNDQFLYTSVAVGAERQRVTFSADFVRDGTLTNALEDTGFTDVDAERDRTIYGVEWAAATSEFGTFTLAVNNQTVEYIEDLVGSPLVDYDYASVGLSYSHRLSEHSTFSVGLVGSILDAESGFGETENIGLNLTYARMLSETLTLRIGAGQYETRQAGSFQPDTRDSSLDVSLTKRWNLWTVTSAISANVEPSAFGVVWRREAASVRIARRFSERLDASVDLQSGSVETNEQTFSRFNRDFQDAMLNINLRVAERLWLSFGVGSRAQEFFERARGTYGQIAFSYRGRGS